MLVICSLYAHLDLCCFIPEPVVKRLKSDSDSESAASIERKFTQDAITDRNIMTGSAVAHQFSQFKVHTSLFIVSPRTFPISFFGISNLLSKSLSVLKCPIHSKRYPPPPPHPLRYFFWLILTAKAESSKATFENNKWLKRFLIQRSIVM